MHDSSYLEMSLNVDRYLYGHSQKNIIADIGSLDVNGSYKNLICPPFQYFGIDLVAGPNVDHIMLSEFNSGLPDSYAASVICGQCLEHSSNPFLMVNEIFRICAPGGYVLLCAPWMWPMHRYPVDCWRFLPDGMRVLIESAGGLFVKSYVNDQDCWGIGRVAS